MPHLKIIKSHDCQTCTMMKYCIVSTEKSGSVNFYSLPITSEVFHENELILSKNLLNKRTAIVRAGILISNNKDSNGGCSLHDIFFPGDIISNVPKLTNIYKMELKTIETSCLCFFNNDMLEQHTNLYIRSLKKQLDFYQEANAYKHKLLSQRNPVKRVALFLLTIIEKKKLNTSESIQFKINLSRQQIGLYLGLVEETIVRALRQLSQLELLQVQSKNFKIPQHHKLLEFYKDPNIGPHNKLYLENELKNKETI